jgi:hypothetical protein
MEVYDKVRVKETKEEGWIEVLVGHPPREAYVSLIPGAGPNYVYFTMWNPELHGVETFTLNLFKLEELEKV